MYILGDEQRAARQSQLQPRTNPQHTCRLALPSLDANWILSQPVPYTGPEYLQDLTNISFRVRNQVWTLHDASDAPGVYDNKCRTPRATRPDTWICRSWTRRPRGPITAAFMEPAPNIPSRLVMERFHGADFKESLSTTTLDKVDNIRC